MEGISVIAKVASRLLKVTCLLAYLPTAAMGSERSCDNFTSAPTTVGGHQKRNVLTETVEFGSFSSTPVDFHTRKLVSKAVFIPFRKSVKIIFFSHSERHTHTHTVTVLLYMVHSYSLLHQVQAMIHRATLAAPSPGHETRYLATAVIVLGSRCNFGAK